MDQVKTFPCPGCGAQLVAGTIKERPDHPHEGLEAVEMARFDDPVGVRRLISHYPFRHDCTMRALVAAVRSLDAGQRDRAQIATESDAKRDRRMADVAAQFRAHLEGFTPPTREDFEDRDPLIGNRCTHGLRLDEPCVKCDEATTHCPPPCGARHDQPAPAHDPNCPRGPMSAIPGHGVLGTPEGGTDAR